MSTVLVTGANRGIGLELCRQYASDGWRVIATCRQPSAARALRGLSGCVEIYALDVTDLTRVQALSRELAHESVDVLIANAGIVSKYTTSPGAIDVDDWMRVFRTNTMAPLACAGAFLHHVARSRQRKMIAMSSAVGSIGSDQTAGDLVDQLGEYVYRSSKAALNAVWRTLAFSHPEIIAISMNPGHVRTEMRPSGHISAEESVLGIRQVIACLTPEDTGTFRDYTGAVVPW
jgi:NAD(P)-dependent dehydrogenase (short-subunit alcohol dehydrogenase family)